MTTLVTGASGHIGAHVVRHLLAQGRAVRALVRPTSNLKGLEGLDVEIVRGDVMDRASLASALEGCSALYHLAAVVAEWAHDPEVIYNTAVDGTANILHAVANQAVDIVLAILLIVGGVFGAQFGARAGRNLRAELFRFLLAILLLGVGLRFAVELIVQPNEPFALTVQESRT